MLEEGMKYLQEIYKMLSEEDGEMDVEKEKDGGMDVEKKKVLIIKTKGVGDDYKNVTIIKKIGYYAILPNMDTLCEDVEKLLEDGKMDVAEAKIIEIKKIIKDYIIEDQNGAKVEEDKDKIKKAIDENGVKNGESIKMGGECYKFEDINNMKDDQFKRLFIDDLTVNYIFIHAGNLDNVNIFDENIYEKYDIVKIDSEKLVIVEKCYSEIGASKNVDPGQFINYCLFNINQFRSFGTAAYRTSWITSSQSKSLRTISYGDFLNTPIVVKGKKMKIADFEDESNSKELKLGIQKDEKGESYYVCYNYDKDKPLDEDLDIGNMEAVRTWIKTQNGCNPCYVVYTKLEKSCEESEQYLNDGNVEKALECFEKIIDKANNIILLDKFTGYSHIKSTDKLEQFFSNAITNSVFGLKKFKINKLSFKAIDLLKKKDYIKKKFKMLNTKISYYLACDRINYDRGYLVKKSDTEYIICEDAYNKVKKGQRMAAVVNKILSSDEVKPIKVNEELKKKLVEFEIKEKEDFWKLEAYHRAFLKIQSDISIYCKANYEALKDMKGEEIKTFIELDREGSKLLQECSLTYAEEAKCERSVVELAIFLDGRNGAEGNMYCYLPKYRGKTNGEQLSLLLKDAKGKESSYDAKKKQEDKVVNDEPGSEEPSAKRRKTE